MDRSTRLHNIVSTALILAIAAGAFAFRLPHLDIRAMHTDEAVHAVKLGILMDTGTYTYNPNEYHGPTLYYFTLPFLWLTGVHSYAEIPSEVPLRIVTVIFGVGLIMLLLLIRDGIGRPAAACAAALTAVSPAMVFYSRYYIQEVLLAFFTFTAIAAGWRYYRSRNIWWALLAGISLGLMYASKETCVIAYGCMLVAAVLTTVWNRKIVPLEVAPTSDGKTTQGKEQSLLNPWHIAAVILVAAIVAALCLTAALTQPRAILDSMLTYVQYVHRASTGDSSTSGSGLHNHPWYYYVRMLAYARYGSRLWWSEAFILLLALVGLAATLRSRSLAEMHIGFARFLAIYALLMTVTYSAIPYKTPWCMLSFLHGLILTAGIGAAAVYGRFKNRPVRVIMCILMFTGLYHLGLQSYRGSFVYHSDSRNPYVYGHTSTDLLKLVDRVEQIAEVHPDGYDMLVEVVVPGADYWPLPWYLRRFSRVGYWDALPDREHLASPAVHSAHGPLIITSPSLEHELRAELQSPYQTEYFGLRPDVLLVTYIKSDLWEEFLEGRK